MSPRKKKGIGFFVSGVAFVVVGGVFVFAQTTPEWVSTGLGLVGLVGQFFGFKTVFPDLGD